MNCQDFENNIEALARGRLMDARARAEASGHEETCARCSARLADERALTAGLRALASATKGAEAPAHVESVLLAAFRARTAASHGAAALKEKSAAPRAGNVRPWSWVRTVAVASTTAAAAAVALFMLIPPDPSVTPAPRDTGEVAGTKDAGRAQDAAPAATRENDAAEERATNATAPDAAGELQTRAVNADKNPRVSSYRPRAANVSYNKGGARDGSEGRSVPAAESARAEEVTTDFMPLVHGENFAQAEGGHLVRVELPRSALARFGLPVNAENAGGRVKADVLLGQDGIARAIRFVR